MADTTKIWTITWQKAKLTRNVEMIGKQDPYIVFKCNGREWRSKVLFAAGKTPKWNQTSDVVVTNVNDKAEIEIWDWEKSGDRIIGSTEVVIKDLVHTDGVKEVTLFFKGNDIGFMVIESKFADLSKNTKLEAEFAEA